MANVVYRCLSFVANDVIFFSDDVQTTTIAVAIASSLCCSIVWAVFHIISVVQPSKASAKTKSTNQSVYDGKFPRRTTDQSVYTDDALTLFGGEDIEVPCVRCGNFYADASCRFVTCKRCCFSVTSCSYHQQNKEIVKPRPCRSHGTKPLHEIDLSHCQIQQCPERLGFVGAQLTLLNLAQNQLSELPSEIGCLRGLTDLYIDHNNISVLPDTLGSLANLQSLNLSYNQIHSLPDTFSSLQKLKVLKAGHNNIESVPTCVAHLRRIVGLYLEYNKLTSFNTQCCSSLGFLEILVLHNNPLSSLPDQIRSMICLRELNVSSCDLQNIPHGICHCLNLTSLDISYNRLVMLPVELGLLHSLQTLHVNNNRLQFLPTTIVLEKYQNITVSSNPFTADGVHVYTPTQLFPSLLETACRYILNLGNYKTEILPQTLQETLGRKKTCTRCGRVFTTYYQSTVELRQTVEGNIPFYSQICSPHLLHHC